MSTSDMRSILITGINEQDIFFRGVLLGFGLKRKVAGRNSVTL
jgi:hypothetical protein